MQQDEERTLSTEIGDEELEEDVDDKGLINVPDCVDEECSLKRKKRDEGGNAVNGNHNHDPYDHSAQK